MDNSQAFSTPKEGLKQTQVLHMAMTIGPILMAGLLWFTNGPDGAIDERTIFSKFLPLILAGVLYLGTVFYKSRLKQVSGLPNLMAKVAHFRASSIVRWATIEGAALISLVFYFFMDSDYIFLIVFIMAMIGMVYFRPTQNQFVEDYKLTNQEISELK